MSAIRRARAMNLDLFCLADDVVFEDPLTDSHCANYSVELPATWRASAAKEWMMAAPTGWAGPKQGWKIHVSAIPRTARAVLDAVVDYCTVEQIPFKYLRSERVLLVCSAKYAPRNSSGKFVTIYPRDEAELYATLHALDARIGGLDGPSILSDLRWKRGPLHVRYGGFVTRWCAGENGAKVHAIERPDGVLVPDERLPYFSAPTWLRVPEWLIDDDVAGRDAMDSCAYLFEDALHFSNAGGVYRGTRRTDGRQVVLKEARPHAGLDGLGGDAIARLSKERSAHRALSALEGVPELLEHFDLGGHQFLAAELAQGVSLQQWLAQHHPGVRAGGIDDTDAVSRYRVQALAILERITELVARVHEAGWVHGDLHPGNVLVDERGAVSVIDFELASERGRETPAGLGCAGFVRPGRRNVEPVGTDDDRYALGVLALWIFLPLAIIVPFDSSKAAAYVRWVEATFCPPRWWSDLVVHSYGTSAESGTAARADAVSLVRGIISSATPTRADRLFPGDVTQFLEDGVHLASGAAGVLWSLKRSGDVVDQRWVDWLEERAEHRDAPGLMNGTAGVALVLAQYGRNLRAEKLLDQALREGTSMEDPTLYSGRAGLGLVALAFGGRDGDAVRLADGLMELRMPEVATPSGQAAGIMDGWSGAAIFLTELAKRTGESTLLDAAEECVTRDLAACVYAEDGALVVSERNVLYPYLAHGTAGIAFAVASLAAAGRSVLNEQQLHGVVRALSPIVVIEPGLFDGRAGLIAALAALGESGLVDTRALVSSHVSALDWHAVSFQGGTALPGRGLRRLSMDLSTGSAGVAAVLSSIHHGGPALPGLPPLRGASRLAAVSRP